MPLIMDDRQLPSSFSNWPRLIPFLAEHTQQNKQSKKDKTKQTNKGKTENDLSPLQTSGLGC